MVGGSGEFDGRVVMGSVDGLVEGSDSIDDRSSSVIVFL